MEKKAASEVEGLQTDELRLMASDETLYQVLDSLRDYLRKCGSTEELTTSILIAAEEIYVNIAHYAYGGKPGEAVVQIEVEPTPGKCRVVFRDRGMPYNPLEKEDPDITLSAEERSIGGLGIFMVKESMDYVDYRYENGENILTIEKSI